MQQILRKVFAPLLNIFERGNEAYEIKPHSRKILIVISILFSCLAAAVYYLLPANPDPGYYLPVIIFSTIAGVGFIIGLLGNDRAIAKIWGNK